MGAPDPEFDPDDNDTAADESGVDFGDDDTAEALIWQLLVLINPGDEESALQQFAAYRDALAEADPDAVEPVTLLRVRSTGSRASTWRRRMLRGSSTPSPNWRRAGTCASTGAPTMPATTIPSPKPMCLR